MFRDASATNDLAQHHASAGDPYDDRLGALAQFLFLRTLRRHWRVDLLYCDDQFRPRLFKVTDDRALWKFVVNFDRAFRSLWFRTEGGGWRLVRLNDDTPKHKLLGAVWAFNAVCPLVDELDLDTAFKTDWRPIARRLGGGLRAVVPRAVPKGVRSSIIWKIGTTARERGASKDEAACLIAASAAFQSKHGTNRNRLHSEVEKVWR